MYSLRVVTNLFSQCISFLFVSHLTHALPAPPYFFLLQIYQGHFRCIKKPYVSHLSHVLQALPYPDLKFRVCFSLITRVTSAPIFFFFRFINAISDVPSKIQAPPIRTLCFLLFLILFHYEIN